MKTADGHTVAARAIVVATNTPVNDRVAIHTKQAPYRTYVVGLRVPRGRVPRALFWDTADPYHYVRLQPLDASSELLIVGGEDHRTGQATTASSASRGSSSGRDERFPSAQGVEFRWSGQVMEPVDGLAFIGRNPGDDDNVFIATGDSGNGMTHGAIAGLLLTDLILGRDEPVERALRPVAQERPGDRRVRARGRGFAGGLCGLGHGRRRRVGGARSRRAKARSCAAASRRSPSTATRPACSSSARRCARISAASSTGTAPRRPGTARATARASRATATS